MAQPWVGKPEPTPPVSFFANSPRALLLLQLEIDLHILVRFRRRRRELPARHRVLGRNRQNARAAQRTHIFYLACRVHRRLKLHHSAHLEPFGHLGINRSHALVSPLAAPRSRQPRLRRRARKEARRGRRAVCVDSNALFPLQASSAFIGGEGSRLKCVSG